MFFSVIIPLYNKEKYIERAVLSVLSQNHKDLELLVINDGSTDRGPDIVQSIGDERVKLFSQNNAGASAARNLGISLASADIVAFLDADDEWLPDFLLTVMHLRKRYPEAGMYATGYRIIKGDGIYRDIRIRNKKDYYGNYFDLIKQGGAVCVGCVAIPRAIFSRVGNFRVGYAMQEDVDMWFRVGVHYKVAHCASICALYHYNLPGSACNINRYMNQSPLLKSFLELTGKKELSNDILSMASHYTSKIEYLSIARTIIAGDETQTSETLPRYKNIFGRNMFYYILSAMKHVPFGILQKGQRLKLRIASIILKWQGALQR